MTYSNYLHAYAPVEGNISTYFGPYLLKPNYDSVKTTDDSVFSGVGLAVLGDINSQSSIEIGMYHFHKVYFREQSTKLIAEKTPLMHITMGYRRWFNETTSAACLLYSQYSMGSIEKVYSDFAAGSEIETSAHDNTEYGFDFSFLKQVYQTDKFNFFLDARYSLSLTSKDGEASDHFSITVGLNYLLQQKE